MVVTVFVAGEVILVVALLVVMLIVVVVVVVLLVIVLVTILGLSVHYLLAMLHCYLYYFACIQCLLKTLFSIMVCSI